MKDDNIKKVFERARLAQYKECISESDEVLHQQFEMACMQFKKKLTELSKKKEQTELSEAIDKIIKTYMDCFYDLAYSYYSVGYRRASLYLMKEYILK